MTNEQIISKMKEDMKMRGFSHWTEESYLLKTKDIMKYFKKPMEEVEIEELRNFLLKHLREERKLSERSVNYYNSVIRFMYEVTMDKIINKKQLPMYRKRRKMKDVLTKEELSTFFNACENYMYKIIFMMIYGSRLRISEAVNLKIEDIDSIKMRIFVREGKKLTIERSREFFRRYRKKAKIDEKFVVHSLRHSFATDLIERGSSILEVKELMGHSNIRSTMEYVHVVNIKLDLDSPLDAFMKEKKNKMEKIQEILNKGLDECGHEEIAYNTCRNRHCPNCQFGKKKKKIFSYQ